MLLWEMAGAGGDGRPGNAERESPALGVIQRLNGFSHILKPHLIEIKLHFCCRLESDAWGQLTPGHEICLNSFGRLSPGGEQWHLPEGGALTPPLIMQELSLTGRAPQGEAQLPSESSEVCSLCLCALELLPCR